jgi:hypothetical protein
MSSDERRSDCVLCRRPVDWPVIRESEFWFAPDHFNYAFLMNLDRHVQATQERDQAEA